MSRLLRTSAANTLLVKADWRVFASMLLVIFGVELVVMIVLGALRPMPPFTEDIVDALALTIFGAPLLWFIVAKPLARGADAERYRSEARVASILQTSVDGIVTTDAGGIILQFNAGAEKIFGYAAREAVGQHINLLLPERSHTAHTELVAHFAARPEASRKTFQVAEVEGRRKNGEGFSADVSVSRLGDGDETMLTAVVRDTTERARAERELRSSETRYRSLFAGMLNGLAHCRMLYDGGGRPVDFVYLDVNEAFTRLTGLTDVIGKPVSEVVPGIRELSPEVFEAYGRVASTGIPETFEFDFKSQRQWLNISVYSPGKDEFVAVFDDITERKRAEDGLRLFRALLDRSTDIIEVVEPDTGRILDVNERACLELGYSREELLAMSVGDLDPMVDPSSLVRNSEQLSASGELIWEGLHKRKDGSTFPVEASISRIQLEREYWVAVVRDITQRKRLAADLLLQSAALNASADPKVITDIRGAIVWINAAFTEVTGYTAAEAVGRNPRELVRSGVQDRAFYKQLWDTILAGKVWRGELTNRRKDGTLYPEVQTITPVRDVKGEISHFIAVKRDLTKDKQLQAQFLQAQKMESVGRLAGGVAHDFNNLLSVILGWSEMAMADLPAGHPIRPALEEVLSAGQRAAGLTRQLLSFSRQQAVEPTFFDVNALVSEMEKMLRRLLGEDIELAITTEPETCIVKMDRGQLEQVLMNLSVNARDAMRLGGELTISTTNTVLDAEYPHRDADVMPGEYVLLAVTDSGTGMSADVKAHVFEPFFTTKEQGKGTGLGLATCYGIVKQAGGQIIAYSEEGFGTTIKVFLPRAAEAAAKATQRRRKTPVHGAETILLVEDDAAVRRVTARMLETQGYRVVSTSSGEEAMRVLEDGGKSFHLLLTDVVLSGGMSGPALVERVRTLRPDVKVLFASGYTSDVTILHGLREHSITLVQKPFTAELLGEKVRQVLDAG